MRTPIDGQVFYGLHMVEGVAEYREPGKDPYRLMISEQKCKELDPSFAGKPVFVNHMDPVDLSIADGYVSESFFNQADGRHWAKFIVTTQEGVDVVKAGWKLSNAYVIKAKSGGGRWHGVDYDHEIETGEYEHLALVPDPRYQESIVLSPDQFKEYNKNKEAELIRLTNSNEKEEIMFFTKAKATNSKDLETMSVKLPKSGIEIELKTLIANADDEAMENEKEDKEPTMANGEHQVQVGDDKMSVNELVEKHTALMAKGKEENDAADADGKKDDTQEPVKKNEEIKPEDKKKENDDGKVDEAKKENEDEKKDEEKKANAAHFESMKNAADSFKNLPETVFELSSHKVARGKARYGSAK